MSALDIDDTKNSLFGNIKKQTHPKKEHKEEASNHIEKLESTSTDTLKDTNPKWKNLENLTVLVEPGQKEGLNEVVKRLMKHRSQSTKGAEKERITANMVIRALITDFLEKKDSLPMEVITNEDEMKAWIRSIKNC